MELREIVLTQRPPLPWKPDGGRGLNDLRLSHSQVWCQDLEDGGRQMEPVIADRG